MKSSGKEPCWGESRLGIREHSKGTLTEGVEPGQVYDGNGEQPQGVWRRGKCVRESQAAGKEPCRGKSRLGKRKCADVGPKHAGDSQGSVRKTNKSGNYVSSGEKFTQGRNNRTGTTKGDNGRKTDAK